MVRDFQDFISHFDVKRKSGNRYQCKCPCHHDKKASLSITDAGDKPLVKCHAGCDTFDILAAVGLEKSDLFYGQQKDDYPKKQGWVSYIEKKTSERQHEPETYVCHWNHILIDGSYAFTKIKFSPKTFTYGFFYDNQTKITNGLYRSGKKIDREDISSFYCPDYAAFKKAIQDGRTVYYVEGEKDCDTLHKYGYQAISCGSSGDWNSEIAKVFDGAKKVIIFSDNDKSGQKSSKQVCRDIRKYCDDVNVFVPTPDIEKGDITDFVDIYGVEGLRQIVDYDMNNFHLVNIKTDKEGNEVSRKITGVYDFKIFEFLKYTRSFFILGGVPYIYSNGIYAADTSGAKLKTMIRKLIFPQFVKSTTIKRIYDLFLSDEELQALPEEVNNYPVEWINFQNGFYDPKNKRIVPHNPEYKSVNQIPYKYDPDEEISSEIMEMFLQWAAADPADREMLLQFYGLCLTLDTRQQKFLMLTGRGGSGKSIVLSLLIAMVGEKNVSNIPLEKLGDRFAPIGLLHKLVNSCADLEITALESTALIKQAIGEDMLRGEFKGKDAISFKSYAKMIFSANELPLVKSEKTNGFYRRLLVLKLDKSPEVVDPYLLDKLKRPENMKYLICQAVKALERMYQKGIITESDTSKEMVQQLRRDSDTVQAFLDFATEPDTSSKIEKGVLFDAYSKYCQTEERTPLKKSNFYKSVIHKGYREVRGKNSRHFKGLKWRSPDGENDGNDGFMSAEGVSLPWE